MRFNLLGVPAVRDATGRLDHPGSPKLRALLVALLLRPNRVVPVRELQAALWGAEPPASARASLHNHVARLRRLLGEQGGLRTVAQGYVLRVEPGELDTEVFQERAATARAAYTRAVRGTGDWASVAEAASAALALWRGSPLEGVHGPGEQPPPLVHRLREVRLELLQWRYDAELELGGHDGLVPELSVLADEFPLREAFHRQLMLVLHRTGRQAEALDAYRTLRRTLVEQLGVDPGPAVRQAHAEVLRGGSGAPAARPEGPRAGCPGPPPAVLADPPPRRPPPPDHRFADGA
ncbi:BTAD domain-containing putative transcriptional regulator [Streptomyces sp. NPDC047999]|uniref:AfsR/SARP family transcriptional regulator n=1 Tax=unclassified Streptomyces TaxID=2593676 RepID=UPI00371E3984